MIKYSQYNRVISLRTAGIILLAQVLCLEARADFDMAASDDTYVQLLSPMDAGAVKRMYAAGLSSLSADPYPDLEPKMGMQVLEFAANANAGYNKGDFVIIQNPPGVIEALGMWVYLTEESNVMDIGFQITDAEGEVFSVKSPGIWEGWKWIEHSLQQGGFEQAYVQNDKNGQIDFPLRSINIVWWTLGDGPTSFGVDALMALTKMAPGAGAKVDYELIAAPWGESGESFQSQFLIRNYSEIPLSVKLSSLLQHNSTYQMPQPIDGIRGTDHAVGKESWTEYEGNRIEGGQLTDGSDETFYMLDRKTQLGAEQIVQVIDMGEPYAVKALGWYVGDANWIKKMNVESSLDGVTFFPLKGFQDINLHHKWGSYTMDLPEPETLRYIRLTYHNDGASLPEYFQGVNTFYVFDGAADETIEMPSVGGVVVREEMCIGVPARSFELVAIPETPPLQSGAYLYSILLEAPDLRQVYLADYFVMPEGEVAPKPSSRFGINSGDPRLVEVMARAGFGWIRFENMKWAFYNPAKGDIRFDGTVRPWVVPFDRYFERYTGAGFSVLPFIFQTPAWASSAPEGITQNIGGYPPRNYSDYSDAVYQAVARYGSQKVDESELITSDKLSGLDLINTYELWNEPNLTAPAWGPWVGTLDEYYTLFHQAAKRVKEADPDAIVLNAGWAGIHLDGLVNTMATTRYPDGTTPLDYTDVLSVHYYTGKQDPEIATIDFNAERSGNPTPDGMTLEEELQALSQWRDQWKPEMPIWVTETGHDVDGPMGLDERYQAAKLPRTMMLAFANGVEKIFIYRETGSKGTQHAGAGLLRDDHSYRASYFVVSNMIRQFEGVTSTDVPRLHSDDPDVWMYYWERPDGGVLTVWAPNEKSTLGVNLGRCLVTDAFGRKIEMEVTEDLSLGMFPLYISSIGNTESLAKLRAKTVK